MAQVKKEYINFEIPVEIKQQVLLAFNKRQQIHLFNGGSYKELTLKKFYIEFFKENIQGYIDDLEYELQQLIKA